MSFEDWNLKVNNKVMQINVQDSYNWKNTVGAHITPTDNQSRNNAEKNKFSFSLIDI